MKIFMFLNLFLFISLGTLGLTSYLLIAHPFLSLLAGILGINLLVLAIYKMG